MENHQQKFCSTANLGQTCLFWKINFISRDTEKQDWTAYQIPKLQEGDVVRLRNSADTAWTEKGTVQEQIESRSYIVSTGNAKYRRNRKDILKTNEDLTSYKQWNRIVWHERAEIAPEIVQNSTTEGPKRQIFRTQRLIEQC